MANKLACDEALGACVIKRKPEPDRHFYGYDVFSAIFLLEIMKIHFSMV